MLGLAPVSTERKIMALEAEMESDEMSDAFMPADDVEEEVETETETEIETVDDENEKNPTALLPTSALGKGVKEGDSVTLTVVKLHGDEVEVSISSGKTKETKPEKSADEELDSMAASY